MSKKGAVKGAGRFFFKSERRYSMHRTVVMAAIALVAGIVLGVAGNQALMAQQPPLTRTILQQKDLEGVAGREVIMFRAETMPGGMSGRHYHAGPELLYVIEGALTLELDGKPPVTIKAGESYYSPPKNIHNAKNASATAQLKLIGFLVGEKGQPMASPMQ